jgi:D-lactate dehydrogenase
MKIAVFDADAYVRDFFGRANSGFAHELVYLEPRMTERTALLAKGFPCVCCFVNDRLTAPVLGTLRELDVRFIALRSAGYNNVDLEAAGRLGLRVARVPAYSPHAVAEHAVGLLLCLDRKFHKAYDRVRDLNFSTSGLMGFDLRGKTVGVIGTGRIGSAFAEIMKGFGCEVLASDLTPDPGLAQRGIATYVGLDELFRRSDVISLHAPLTPATRHLISSESIALMKPGVYLINTSRGALLDAKALIEGLKAGRIAGAGLDVYEEEEGIFYENLSDQMLQDDVLARLLTFPNVLITSHQAYLTREAMTRIAETTLSNVRDFEEGRTPPSELRARPGAPETAA